MKLLSFYKGWIIQSLGLILAFSGISFAQAPNVDITTYSLSGDRFKN
ncbi:hypothetical protein GOQ04_21555 [Emticicia sp. ODNR4P]|jgi:hypothetical protein|nr:hypothetical protein [Emticicia sp. ODNR4P]